jgi:hypothetical protein
LTAEKVQELTALCTKKENDLRTLEETNPKDLWLADLVTLEQALQTHEAQAADRATEADALRKKLDSGKPTKKKDKTKKQKQKTASQSKETKKRKPKDTIDGSPQPKKPKTYNNDIVS